MISVALGLFLAGVAAPPADPCAGPAAERAPDPRCGETLDGREPAEPSAARRAGQVALAVPRLGAQAAFWPVVTTVDFLEHHRTIDWARALLTTDDGRIGVRPELQYSTSFMPSGGARFFYRRLPGAGSELMARARTAGTEIFLGQLGLRGPDALGLSALATWDRRNDRLYAGIGPNSNADLAAAGRGPARYQSDELGTELRWRHQLPLRLNAQAHGDLLRRRYEAGAVVGGPSVADVWGLPPEECEARGLPSPCVDERQLPRFTRGLDVVRVGGGMGLDLRNPSRDGSGFTFAADATYARGVFGDPSRHVTVSSEMVIAIGGRDRLLLLRGRGAMIERLSAAPIPFDQLLIPGGTMEMRGIAGGRLRGESALVGSTEYRWFISSYLDASLFVDVGTVAGERFSGIAWDRWFPSFGLGFRFYQPQGPYWEARAEDGIQLAYAPEGGFRLLFSMAGF